MNILTETIRRLFFLPPAYPQTIQIGLTNVCNFNCRICQRFDLGVEIKHLNFEVIKKIIAKIDVKKCPHIILTGWGEPLCHPQILVIVELLSQKGFKVRLTTNGSLLDADKSRFLLQNDLAAITFSIDELVTNAESLGHKISNQLLNLENFIKLRNELAKATKVYLQTTYAKDGESKILKIIDYAENIGAEAVRISRLDIRFRQFARPSQAEELAFIKKIEDYIKDKNIKVDFLPYLALTGWARQAWRLLSRYLHRGGKYCLRIFSDLYINENGQATPCCALPKYIIGNAVEIDIGEIWNSAQMKKFRDNQKKICGACDVLEINYKG
jgi:MoaA/NifB/PqqE/SkfB family radical SAM enzyme